MLTTYALEEFLQLNPTVKHYESTGQTGGLPVFELSVIAYLLLWYLKMKSKFSWSTSNLFALVRMNLFSRKSLWAWLDDPFPKPMDYPVQLPLFDYAT